MLWHITSELLHERDVLAIPSHAPFTLGWQDRLPVALVNLHNILQCRASAAPPCPIISEAASIHPEQIE